jgi:ribose transport system substrate-binding protein
VNLDLVDSGQVYAVVGQPLYEESKGSAELLYKMANGEDVPYWTVLEAPLITKADLGPWYELLDRMEGKMRPTPAP